MTNHAVSHVESIRHAISLTILSATKDLLFGYIKHNINITIVKQRILRFAQNDKLYLST